jgi:Cys-tRNA(Pro)/Cys-tRNA(Cys) deacylase
MKTNAARLLDSLGIAYEVRTYEVDPEDLTAIAVAKKINMPLQQVFKTLLTRVDNGPTFAVVAGDAELHLKKLAALAGGRKAELMPLANVEPLTGYVRGGVTVLAAKKAFPVFVDGSLELFDVVSVSAGARGAQLVLSPQDYLAAIEQATGEAATVGDISRPQQEAAP